MQVSSERVEREEAVLAAARAERAALTALTRGAKPTDQDWDEDEEQAYRARLARWMEASRVLVDALGRVSELHRSSRATAVGQRQRLR
jgi:hypothetical protein